MANLEEGITSRQVKYDQEPNGSPQTTMSKATKKASIQTNHKDCKEELEALPFLAIMDDPSSSKDEN